MKLILVNPADLDLDRPLPFALRDEDGRLLLAAGMTPTDAAHRDELRAQPLYAEEGECAAWRRRLAAAMDEKLRRNELLKDVVSVRADMSDTGPVAMRPQTVAECWFELRQRLDTALRDVDADTDWRPRLLDCHARLRLLLERRADASLYHLVFEATHHVEKYSAHHALLCATICEQAAAVLGWPQAEIDSLGRAALTMNVAMRALQDQLAVSTIPVTSRQREQIDDHAATGADQLAAAGLGDALAIEVVRLHHDAGEADRPLAALSAARRLARLLRRVDIFSATISRRASRPGLSPLVAAREACLGPDGRPDEVGGAVLKVMGVYPPGSFVELVSGEVGIVVARGRRVDLPLVVALMRPGGEPYAEPLLRDTLDRRHAVKAAAAIERVRVHVQHDKVLALAGAVARAA